MSHASAAMTEQLQYHLQQAVMELMNTASTEVVHGRLPGTLLCYHQDHTAF